MQPSWQIDLKVDISYTPKQNRLHFSLSCYTVFSLKICVQGRTDKPPKKFVDIINHSKKNKLIVQNSETLDKVKRKKVLCKALQGLSQSLYKPYFFFGTSPSYRENGCGSPQQCCFFVDLDGLHVRKEIGFSVPRGLKPLLLGDKCLLCGNTVWLTDTAQSLIPPLPPRRTWINHLHGKATVLRWNSCLVLSSLLSRFRRAEMAVGLTLKHDKYKQIKCCLLTSAMIKTTCPI